MILEPIQCNNFLLREIDLEKDKESYIKSMDNPNVVKGITVRLPYTEESWEQFISYYKRNCECPRSFLIGIDVDGKIVGNVTLSGETSYYNDFVGTFGYFLAEEQWGRGIMSEAIGVLTDLMFEKYNFKKLIIPTFDFNMGSQKVAEKNGYKYTYTDEKDACKDGKTYIDTRYYHKFNGI